VAGTFAQEVGRPASSVVPVKRVTKIQ
jgi:hypothetical protein